MVEEQADWISWLSTSLDTRAPGSDRLGVFLLADGDWTGVEFVDYCNSYTLQVAKCTLM